MLIVGHVADRYNRRSYYAHAFDRVLRDQRPVVVSLFPNPSVPAIYGLLLVNAVARTFEQPVMQSLVPVMAPRAILSRAIAAHVSAGRLSMLLGPSLGGVLYLFGPDFDYGVCTLLVLAAAVASFLLPNPPMPAERPKVTWDTLIAGFRFIWRCQAVLGAMSFDLIATLFGGVTALIPIFARDILISAMGLHIRAHRPPWGTHDRCRPHASGACNGGVFLVGFAFFGLGVTCSLTNVALCRRLVAARRRRHGQLCRSPDHHHTITPDDAAAASPA
jgi:hypothetical protein